MKKVLWVIIAGAVSAQLFAQGKPKWVDSPKTDFPERLYVSATGGGRNRTAAENAAKGALVAFFKQSVSSTITITDTERQTSAGSTSRTDMTQSIAASAALDSLIGVEIQTWEDTKGKTGWWAVAVMEKAGGRKRYAGELDKTVQDINRLIDVSDGISLETVGKCVIAKGKIADAEMYALVLSMLDGPDRQPEVGALAAKVDKALADAKAIAVDVRVNGDVGGRIKAPFAKAFTALGFRTGNSNSRYALEVSFSREPAPQNKYYNSRYTVDAVLKDTKTGAELY
jgi:hypothetical protein